MSARPVLLFDFDGVIFDAVAINRQVFREFYPEMSEDEMRGIYEGNGVEKMHAYHARMGTQHPGMAFSLRYQELQCTKTLHRWASDVLRQLAQRFTLAIVSTSREEGIEDRLRHAGVHNVFAGIYGRRAHDSKVEKIKMAFTDHGGSPANALFITDTLGDIREARHAGVDAIGVTWGYHEQERLAKGTPWAIVHTPDHLSSTIERYFSL